MKYTLNNREIEIKRLRGAIASSPGGRSKKKENERQYDTF